MTIAEMFGQSGILALLGMGIVFSFLIILIVFMTLVAKTIHALGWDADVQAPKQVSAAAAAGAPTNNAAVIAAVSAAVNEYRKNNP
jgi:oxaloacetate decarboxylase gamma subunit